MAIGTNSRIGLGREIFDYFVAKGMPPHQAAAIAGNMAWEGGGRTDLVNPGDNWKNSPRAPHSVGIAQWNDRSPALIEFARKQGIEIPEGDLRDPKYAQDVIRRIPLQTQLDFAYGEMQGPEKGAYQRIAGAGDLRGATAGAIGYHRPAGWTAANPEAGHGFMGRLSLADQILKAGPSTPQPPDAMDAAGYTPKPNAPVNPWTAPIDQITPPPAPTYVAKAPAPPASASPGSLFGALFPGVDQTLGGVVQPQGGDSPQMKLANAAMLGALDDGKKQAPDDDGGLRLLAPQIKPQDLQKLRSMLMRSKSQLGLA